MFPSSLNRQPCHCICTHSWFCFVIIGVFQKHTNYIIDDKQKKQYTTPKP
eukprot:m.71685 g.71685  ORF g.71685 m.71685 type:complete len:50 (+) comp13831_c3_seq1:411-560(+)